MNEIQYRSIDEIAEVLQDLKAQNRSCSLLIGAGVSVAAGIPPASGFVDAIRDRYPHAYARAAVKTYPKCMAELTSAQRRNLIADYVDRSRINWAHVGIALLMKQGFIDRVLTTNFDPLVVRACALLGLFPAVYDFASSQLLQNAELPKPSVFYLHGQRSGFVLMNREEDMAAHSKLLGPVFDGAGDGRTWIVVGYSGENDPVFDHLARQPRFFNGLFWVGYQDREPPAHVRDQLLNLDKDAFYTKGHDADSFFVSLTRALHVFPPDVVAKPFSFVLGTFAQLTPFVHPGQTGEEDVMRAPNEWIRQAIAQFEDAATRLIARDGTQPGGRDDRAVVVNAVQYLSMQGDYERVVAFRTTYEKDPSPELGELISTAYVLLGNRLLDQAKQRPGDARALFETARPMYEAALAIHPARHEALHNWANFLLDLAKGSVGAAAEAYFDEAATRYAAASRIKPDQAEILINWGNLLLDRAKTRAGPEADALFDEAEAKFESAIALDARLPNAHQSHGNLLLDRAKTLAGAAAETMFDGAERCYRAALALDPAMAEAFYQWGNVCLDRAKRRLGGRPEDQFDAGIENYKRALAIRPAMYQALNNWASLLVDFGKTLSGAAALARFEEADRRYAEATTGQPDFFEAWNNWGNLLLDWRKREDSERAAMLFSKAEAKYREAHRLRPDAPEPLDNWGNLLLDQAKSLQGRAADDAFDAAVEKYAEAFRLRPTMYGTLNNWGNCLSDQARRRTGDDARRLFAKAEDRYRAALAMRPDDADVLRNLARTLVDSGLCASHDEAARRIAEGAV